ncbi:MAG: hypothetical protein LBU57_04970, partial [Dysgonamonadaceae bacterium]|nr:hypothetical protein [Dysgonamonadaceae bacterium]
MNQRNLHNELISILKLQTPKDTRPVDLLMKYLPISKESAYRRLRGEIQLSLDEAIILAKKMEVSLDNLISKCQEDKYTFHISPFIINHPLDKYSQTLADIMDSYQFIKSDPDCFCYMVGKILYPTFYFKHKEFTQFTLFKWIYLVQDSTQYPSFSEIIIPPQLEELFKSFWDIAIQIPSTYILNDFLFTSLAKDLRYYLTINLLTKKEVEILKTQILMIIDEMEETAVLGTYKNGAKVSMYITDSYFDFSYNYIKGNGFDACGIGIYGLNFISCQNKQVTKNQRIWIES